MPPARQPLPAFAGFPRAPLLARSVLVVAMGALLLWGGSASWTTLTSATTLLLFSDGVLGILLRHDPLPESLHLAFAWLRQMWQVNLTLTTAALLAALLNPSLLVTTVIVIMTALTASFWLVAFVWSEGSQRRALLGWICTLFVAGAFLRLSPTLPASSEGLMDLRGLGAAFLLLGCLMMWWSMLHDR